ncbi:MAG: ATP-binding cassette domain-containing protein [Flavobacteriaceae bacterium]
MGGFHSLAFDKVCFNYNEGQKVLNNISFELLAGKTIALVGSSGAGKSTLANIAARFLEPDSGHLIINGQPANEIDLASYRKQLGVVLQDDFLFDGTIRENVLYGNPECSEEELASALDAAYVSEFVGSLEKGTETVIGERGIKLSGGQRQRLAIARALVANPRLLILDEATSNLDAESEYYIQLGLENLTRNRATLVIAHRLSTIQNADIIIVLEKGEIVESGTHKELFEKQGRYHSLYTRQARI